MSADSPLSFTRFSMSVTMDCALLAPPVLVVLLLEVGGAIVVCWGEGIGAGEDCTGVMDLLASLPVDSSGVKDSDSLAASKSFARPTTSPADTAAQTFPMNSFCSAVVETNNCTADDCCCFFSSSRISPSQGVCGSSSDRVEAEGRCSGFMIERPPRPPEVDPEDVVGRKAGCGRNTASFIDAKAWIPLSMSTGEADPVSA
mmetsp:Transcript_12208/g.18450  ORF Transcript_12208/g.18450 Transcript_12208/m.18450 type:complete len:201 (-) Transcript_12208:1085-1687(-)